MFASPVWTARSGILKTSQYNQMAISVSQREFSVTGDRIESFK